MRYETPELKALTPAISAIQDPTPSKVSGDEDGISTAVVAAYEDWE